MDEHGNEHTLHPFTKLLWQRYFRPPRSYCQSATASTFSIFSRKGAKNSRFSCSTCPEAPATMSSPGSFFFNRKIIRRSGPPSQQIKSNQNQRVHARAPGMAARHEGGRRAGRPWPQVSPASPPPQARSLARVAGLYAPLARPLDLPSSFLHHLPASEPYLLLRPSVLALASRCRETGRVAAS